MGGECKTSQNRVNLNKFIKVFVLTATIYFALIGTEGLFIQKPTKPFAFHLTFSPELKGPHLVTYHL